MNDVVYLAWRYLAYHRFKSVVLIGSLTMIFYLPLGLNILVNQSARELTMRAEATPLLVGALGSPLELVLSSLYFESDTPPEMAFEQAKRVAQSGLAQAIPLHVRYRSTHGPIVGTTFEYFALRGLEFAQGRPFGMLGECVLGAEVARDAGIGPGDSIMSVPENVFDIAGVYPLKMQVVGVLQQRGTPDDRAVLVDVKTTWVIAGLAHGHEDLTRNEADAGVLRTEGNTVIANASVMQYNEITAENVASFHFHGDPDQFPITAVIAMPRNAKSAALLEGRYLGENETVQVVDPGNVMSELLETVLTVRRYVLLAVGLVAAATLATMALVFLLSFQLRRRELETIARLGGSRRRVAALIGMEVLGVVVLAIAAASLLAWATTLAATSATRWLVQLT